MATEDVEMHGDEGSFFDEPLGNTEAWLWDVTDPVRQRSGRDSGYPSIVDSIVSEDMPLFHMMALVSCALGITSRAEIILVGLSHMLYWFFGFTGVDAMYSVAAGFLFAKKIYRFAALPAFLDVYTVFQTLRQDWDFSTLLRGDTIIKLSLFVFGFVAAKLKYV